MHVLHQILTDARFGLRRLVRRPIFGATLLIVLIAGIGSTTAMFSLVTSLLLRPLPYPDPDRLTMIWGTQVQVPLSPLSIADFLDWKRDATTFSEMAAVENDSFSLSSAGDTPESLPGARVSGDFFPTFRMVPLRGRFLGPDDDRVGAPHVVVLSARVWQGRFASDEAIVGRAVSLDGGAFTVVGIAPEGFQFAGPWMTRCDLWTALAATHPNYEQESRVERGSHFLNLVGRRKPGVSLEQAQAEIATIARSIEVANPNTNSHFGVKLTDLHDALVRNSRSRVELLFVAIGLVFLAICANVANLLLVEAVARRSEMAARSALGATAGRLLAQLVTETASVFVLAGALGALAARSLVGIFADGFVGRDAASTIDVHVDTAALVFAIGLALACGIVVGIVPALEAQRVAPHTVIKESGARASLGRRSRLLRGGLVVVQVALAFVLLVGSGLSARAFMKFSAMPLGFDPTALATATVLLPPSKWTDDARVAAFWRDVLDRIASEPGVTSVAANSCVPLGARSPNSTFEIEGRTPWPDGTGPLMQRNVVTPGYFRTMGMTLLRGRDLTTEDVAGASPVVVVNQAVAERFFPGEDPIGHRIQHSDGARRTWREIVGVVGDVPRNGPIDGILNEAYTPLAQSRTEVMTFVAKTADPEGLLRRMPAIVAAVDPDQAVAERALMTDRVARSTAAERFTTRLLVAFAFASLALATLGIFGLVSYSTSQRTRELGIRFALGSSPQRIVMVVVRDGMILLGAGLVAGAAAALFAGRGIAAQVPGAASFDGLVFGAILIALTLAGVLASLLPALRAIRIPPAAALRCE